MAPLPNCKQAPSFQPKTSWDSGWSTGSRRVVARGQLPRIDTRHTYLTGAQGNWGWALGGEKAHHTRGECAHQAPGFLSCSGREGTKRRPNLVHAFVENPKTETAGNAGPAPYRAAGSLSSVDGKAQTPLCGANPVWPEHCECSPHRPGTFVCSGPPSLQHNWTSEPEQETTFTRVCQGGN